MPYVVDRVVICDAFTEPGRHYQLLAGGRSKLAERRRPSMRFLASALPDLAVGQVVDIGGASYRVRDVRARAAAGGAGARRTLPALR